MGKNNIFGIECNLEELNAIDFKKGCYVGQENTARIKLKNKLSRRLFSVKMISGKINDDRIIKYNNIEIGKAKLLNVGTDITIITYGSGVHESIKTIKKLSLSADLIDLRTLSPLDNDSIIQSVRKTGKAIILQEDSLFGGLASEISSIDLPVCLA